MGTQLETRLAKPELLTRAEFISLKITRFRQAGLGGRSPRRETLLGIEHREAVRAAVSERRDIHVENWHDYKSDYPALHHYSFNGNLAVYDSSIKPLTRAEKDGQYQAAVELSDLQERRKVGI